jgi:hypothetical protein
LQKVGLLVQVLEEVVTFEKSLGPMIIVEAFPSSLHGNHSTERGRWNTDSGSDGVDLLISSGVSGTDEVVSI